MRLIRLPPTSSAVSIMIGLLHGSTGLDYSLRIANTSMLTLRWWMFEICEGNPDGITLQHMYKSKASMFSRLVLKASRSSIFDRGQIQPTCQCRHGLQYAREEAAPEQDTGALITIPEAFEMDALSTSRRRSNGFTPTAKAVSHWISLPLVVIPDASAYNQLYVTAEIHLLKELYLNGKAYLTRWYLTLPPIVRTAIPMRYTTCNWYISGENRLFCANT